MIEATKAKCPSNYEKGYRLISIIIPCFNSVTTLAEAIASLPSRRAESSQVDIEIIMVDDGSTDGTDDLIRNFSLRDSRIIPVINKKNQGVSFSRNVGLKKAKGDFVFFLDADDKLQPGALDYLFGFMTPDVDFVRGKHVLWDPTLNSRKLNVAEEYSFSEIISVPPAAFPQMMAFYSSWNSLFRRSLIVKEELKFNESLKLGEDRLFNFEYLMVCRKISLVGAYTYLWRRNDPKGEQATQVRTKEAAPMFRSIAEAVDMLGGEWLSKRPYHRSWLATQMLLELCNNMCAFSYQIERGQVSKTTLNCLTGSIQKMRPNWIRTDKDSVKGYVEAYVPLYDFMSKHVGQEQTEGLNVLTGFFALLGKIRRKLSEEEQRKTTQSPDHEGMPILQLIFVDSRKRRPSAILANERQIISQSQLFDPAYYCAVYPDVDSSGIDPLTHFLEFGTAEMRNPNSWFKTRAYFKRNSQLIVAGMNPLAHYALLGPFQRSV